ncbi:MAG: hypothetical protein AAB480_03910 [Patescibacteria group bacterium]
MKSSDKGQPKVARVIPPNECVISCKGWSIAFVWDYPLEDALLWEKFHGNAIDDRPMPQPPNLDPLRPLKELTRWDRIEAKKLAFGTIKGNRARALKRAVKEATKTQRALEEPTFL